MISATRDILSSVMKTDPTITPDAAKMVFAILSGKDIPAGAGAVQAQVLSRHDVATMCHLHPKRVDAYSRSGIFKRVYFPGSTRAAGISRASVENALERAMC